MYIFVVVIFAQFFKVGFLLCGCFACREYLKAGYSVSKVESQSSSQLTRVTKHIFLKGEVGPKLQKRATYKYKHPPNIHLCKKEPRAKLTENQPEIPVFLRPTVTGLWKEVWVKISLGGAFLTNIVNKGGFPFAKICNQLIRISCQTDQLFRFIHGFDRTVQWRRNWNTFETIWMRTV